MRSKYPGKIWRRLLGSGNSRGLKMRVGLVYLRDRIKVTGAGLEVYAAQSAT